MKGWEEIFKKAHLNESSNLSRTYFEECGLKFEDVNMDNLKVLRRLINEICFKLCADKTYQMVKDFEVNSNIKKDKWGFYLTMYGSYFNEREAVSFWNPKTNNQSQIGFCGWADGCNRIPIIKGFIKWCDWMRENKK